MATCSLVLRIKWGQSLHTSLSAVGLRVCVRFLRDPSLFTSGGNFAPSVRITRLVDSRGSRYTAVTFLLRVLLRISIFFSSRLDGCAGLTCC
jgi:hypothetical protein